MGTQEQESHRRTKRTNLKKLILESVKIAGLLGLIAVAPNVIGSLHKLGVITTKRQSEYVRAARSRLVTQGLLKFDGKFLSLTPKGDRALRLMDANEYSLSRPRRWDGKWRILIFDIPERLKAQREKIRGILMKVGFIHLQHSVWVYPFDCEDIIVLIKADMKIGNNVRYIIADSIENDSHLRKSFQL